ncbi:hypothetical protein FRC10_006789 [Ceratobasidium sp. 414]|nr:hypothetical protein FRC10_006789 [Ceratobasidium sp. 414]
MPHRQPSSEPEEAEAQRQAKKQRKHEKYQKLKAVSMVFMSPLPPTFPTSQPYKSRIVTSWRTTGSYLKRSRRSDASHGNREKIGKMSSMSKKTLVAQLLKLFTLKGDDLHSLAYTHLFKIGRRSKTTRFIELADTRQQNFIFANSIIRSCVVLSPGIYATKHILWDLEGPDMYLRLQDL